MNAAVVGGGIGGLVAAYRLALAGAQVTVLEAGSRWGGQIHTERWGRFVVEHGAEGYAAARTAPRELCTTIGIAGRLVSQITSKALVVRNGVAVPIPAEEAARLAGILVDRADVGHGLTSLHAGMGELIDALVAVLRERVGLQLESAVVRLARGSPGWSLTTATGETRAAQAIVLAVPAAVAASLLESFAPAAADLLGGGVTRSSVSVSLALARRAVAHPLDAGGLVFPGGMEAEGLRACTFVSSKFPRRAPRGRVLLRAFFRPGGACPIDAPQARWTELAVDSLWGVLGVAGAPLRSWIARWPQAIPQYRHDHSDRLARVRAILAGEAPGLELAGAAFGGPGVAGAIESAEEAVRRVLAEKGTPPQRYGSGGSEVS